MGLNEDFETSLQVLRGFETDISTELNEIKVFQVSRNSNLYLGHLETFRLTFPTIDYFISICI